MIDRSLNVDSQLDHSKADSFLGIGSQPADMRSRVKVARPKSKK